MRHSRLFRVFAVIVVACTFPAAAHAARVAILSNAWSAETAADYNAKIGDHEKSINAQ